MVLLFNVCETVSISLYLDIIMYIIYIYTRCKWRENCTWHDRNAKRHLTRWLHLMSEACVWTVDSHVQKHTRRWLHTQKAWMLFPYSQLLGAESLPAGSVWSHWDALHLSEEGRSQWDRTTVLSAWRHLLCSPPSFSPAMTASIPYSYPHSFSLHPFWAFMCCCHVLAWCTIISCAGLLQKYRLIFFSCSINGHQSFAFVARRHCSLFAAAPVMQNMFHHYW